MCIYGHACAKLCMYVCMCTYNYVYCMYIYNMQDPPNSDGQVNQYYVYYGKRDGTTLEKILVDSVNATIQLSQNSLNETFVVQLSTFTESVESSMTLPVMQCKKP